MSTLELTALIPRTWQIKPTANAIRLIAPDREEALDLIKGARSYLKQSAERLRCELAVFAYGCDRPLLRIKAATPQPSEPATPRSSSPFDLVNASISDLKGLPDSEMAIAIFSSSQSACITTVAENKILQANFAVAPSHGKPYHQMIGSDLTPLWDVDELSRVMAPLQQDGFARALTYWTWKWEAQQGGIYTRNKQTLTRHCYLINFAGVPCRLTVGVE